MFRMHSNSKIAAPIAAMLLFDQGCFGPDDPIADFTLAFSDMQVVKPDARVLAAVQPRFQTDDL